MAGKVPTEKKPVKKPPKFKGKPTLRQIANAAAKEGMQLSHMLLQVQLQMGNTFMLLAVLIATPLIGCWLSTLNY